jgi:hypothetical protein
MPELAVILSLRYMKNFIVVILALVYFATTTGATLSLHYCMGKIAGWELGQNKAKTCGFCGMEKGEEKDNGCCKDEQKFIKNDNDQKFVESASVTFHFPVVAETPFYPSYANVQPVSVKEQNPVSHAPPRYRGLPIYISNRIFLI